MNEDGGSGGPWLGPIPWRALLGDLIILLAWVGVVSFAWGLFRWPTWTYYVVVFGGILVYSVATDPWRPGGPA